MWHGNPDKLPDICISSQPSAELKTSWGLQAWYDQASVSTNLMSNNTSVCGSQTPWTHNSVIKVSATAELLHTIGSFMT